MAEETVDSLNAQIDLLEAALTKMALGEQVSEIKYGAHGTKYTPSSQADVRRRIAELTRRRDRLLGKRTGGGITIVHGG